MKRVFVIDVLECPRCRGPKRKELEAIGESWRPYRPVAPW
jgi:3-methyladenine DNA glycosylase/8-oxoguanine DNA glycosylase